MSRAVSFLIGFVVVFAFGYLFTSVLEASDDSEVTMYLTPTCGCCSTWADYLEEEGFEVDRNEVQSTRPIQMEEGVPAALGSCHTAIVGGYVVEGHVPAEDIRKLLDEKPDAAGITVPGMPIGSPGMEVPGREPESYEVLLFDEEGNTAVFAEH